MHAHHVTLTPDATPRRPFSPSVDVVFYAVNLRAELLRLEQRLAQYLRILAGRNGAPARDKLAEYTADAQRAQRACSWALEGTRPGERVTLVLDEAALRQLAPGLRIVTCGELRAVVFRGVARFERRTGDVSKIGAPVWRAVASGRWHARPARLQVRGAGLTPEIVASFVRQLQRPRGAV